jgi:hypothetical protein
MSLLMFSMTGLVVLSLKTHFHRFMEIFALVFGVAGVVASNPFGRVLAGYVLMAIYIATFRLFCAAQLEMIGSRAPVPAPQVFWLMFAFVALWAVFDAITSLESEVLMRDVHGGLQAVIAANWPLITCRIVYIVAVIALVAQKGRLPAQSVQQQTWRANALPRWLRSQMRRSGIQSSRDGKGNPAGAFAVFWLHINREQLDERLEKTDAAAEFALDEDHSESHEFMEALSEEIEHV